MCDDQHPGRHRLRSILTALALLGLPACGAGTEDVSGEIAAVREDVNARFSELDDRLTALEQDRDDPEVGAEDLLRHPARYAGEPVTTTAVVEEVVTDNAFVISVPGGSLIVLAASADTSIVEQGSRVRVAGTVGEALVIPDFEQATDIELDVDALAEYQDHPYLAADVIGDPVNDAGSGAETAT